MPPKFYKKYSTKKGPATAVKVRNILAEYLIIVESPSKCEKIESYLGNNYCCIASKGHIRELKGLKSIDTKHTFEPTFSLMDGKTAHIQSMRDVINRFSKNKILLASDDDREGEAIAWHICQVFDLPVETTQRIIFHEVTKPALEAAVRSPTNINMDVVRAQHARQVLDIIVGFKISPFLWRYLFNNKSNSLSAGRCQTPALRLVYDNEKERSKGVETKYKTTASFFSFTGTTQKTGAHYELNKEFDTNDQVLDFLHKSQDFPHSLKLASPKESRRSPPRPFSTSRMLQTASNVLHISPKETMNLCQKLYQSGHITYMRTESSQYSPVFIKKSEEYIQKKYGEKYVGSNDGITSKDSSNPHEAIRVTNIEASTIPSDENRLISLYRLIWRNTVESCMSDAKYNSIKATIAAPLELAYEHTIEIPLFLGWRMASCSEKEYKDAQVSATAEHMYLTSLSAKTFTYNWIESAVVVRNKHQHYTEASLINTLEELGIGRPSTFATIVDTNIERGYVKKMDIEGSPIMCKEYRMVGKNIEESQKERIFGNEKAKLLIQPTGILTIEFLLKTFDQLFSYQYTRNMEELLDKVSSGIEKDWSKICSDCLNEIKTLSKQIKDLSKQSYVLDENHEVLFASFGPVIRKIDQSEDAEENKKPPEYIQVRKDIVIDLEKVKRGEYSYDDLVEIPQSNLGMYEGEPIYLKNGRFGPYVEWGDKKESIKGLKTPLHKITLEDIERFLSRPDGEGKEAKGILKRVNDVMSVRKSKFGLYVYYKRPDMTKPQFLNIKPYKGEVLSENTGDLVEWLCEKYNLPSP